VRIDWWTLALQTVNFLVLVWLLQHFLYKPVTAVIERRRAATNAVLQEAETAKLAAEALQQELAGQRAGIAAEREVALTTARAAAEADRAALLQRASAEAGRTVDAAWAEAARVREAAEQAVRQQASTLAVAIVRRLVAEQKPTLDALCEALRAAPPSAGPVSCVTAAPLDAAEQARWRARLAEALGPADIDFAVDPSLIEGAELRFPHAVLRRNLADDLARIAEELARERA
jgi:F0F1-type ATP synthase membrane subunit b/b'